jgi:hypothetical protein
VRQSSFALVGDLAGCCVAHLLPAFAQLLSAALALLELPRLTDAGLAAANNACWSLGEMLVAVDTERVAPHAGETGRSWVLAAWPADRPTCLPAVASRGGGGAEWGTGSPGSLPAPHWAPHASA